MPKKKPSKTPSEPAVGCAAHGSAWFERGWLLASCSTYLGASRMSYAKFRHCLYRGDARHPKLVVIREVDVSCKCSVSPKGYTARSQFQCAWEIFVGWFECDQNYQLLLYLPTRRTEIAGRDLAGGQFHRWLKPNADLSRADGRGNHETRNKLPTPISVCCNDKLKP